MLKGGSTYVRCSGIGIRQPDERTATLVLEPHTLCDAAHKTSEMPVPISEVLDEVTPAWLRLTDTILKKQMIWIGASVYSTQFDGLQLQKA